MLNNAFGYYMEYEHNIISEDEFESLIRHYGLDNLQYSSVTDDDFYGIIPSVIDSVLR